MTVPVRTLPFGPTARDLLVAVAGNEHDTHSIVARRKQSRGVITFACSCGEVFKIIATPEISTALRNVAEETVKMKRSDV